MCSATGSFVMGSRDCYPKNYRRFKETAEVFLHFSLKPCQGRKIQGKLILSLQTA